MPWLEYRGDFEEIIGESELSRPFFLVQKN
jgi:hypothetical protein